MSKEESIYADIQHGYRSKEMISEGKEGRILLSSVS